MGFEESGTILIVIDAAIIHGPRCAIILSGIDRIDDNNRVRCKRHDPELLTAHVWYSKVRKNPVLVIQGKVISGFHNMVTTCVRAHKYF
jgi:hypothetical protein